FPSFVRSSSSLARRMQSCPARLRRQSASRPPAPRPGSASGSFYLSYASILSLADLNCAPHHCARTGLPSFVGLTIPRLLDIVNNDTSVCVNFVDFRAKSPRQKTAGGRSRESDDSVLFRQLRQAGGRSRLRAEHPVGHTVIGRALSAHIVCERYAVLEQRHQLAGQLLVLYVLADAALGQVLVPQRVRRATGRRRELVGRIHHREVAQLAGVDVHLKEPCQRGGVDAALELVLRDDIGAASLHAGQAEGR